MPRFVLERAAKPERLDKALSRLLSGTSRATVQRWIAEGRVQVDGRACRPRDTVRAGSVIDVEPGAPPPSRAEPDASLELDVLYEDVHLIVINKPAGLVMHPARGHRSGTLVNALLARPGFARPPSDPLDREGALRPGVVHRLDKDTSGVLVVAKDEAAREALKAELQVHATERVYRAIACGIPGNVTLSTLHARHPRSRLRFSSKVKRGRRAVTHVRVIERLASGRAALVECRLETGRTHQIRVHLAEQTRTPILADALYGGVPSDPELRSISDELGRQALHAAVLGFTHPATGRRLRFEAPLPEDLQRALGRLRTLK
jgi:23S rRNA pseudouridine1911/1915/1917 synthase